MNSIRVIAIYLPQFHPIPENDEAWGRGFTEWTNVKNATPVFEGHYQPHIPHDDIGYYDLRNPDVLDRQAKIAKQYGIYGFAFYHYWFNGKRLLETPLDNMLSTGKPDFPFCCIWANENWTKRWDGTDNEAIMRQNHNHEDNLKHITFLCENIFSDSRYIKIDNKPLFLIYKSEIIPDIRNMVKCWREIVKKFGFEDIFLVRVDNVVKNINPVTIDFDGVLEFGPDFDSIQDSKIVNNYNVINYQNLIENMIAKEHKYKTFNCVFPGWDNSPRRKRLRGFIFINNTPELFKLFMSVQIINTLNRNSNKDEQILFVNAWNEWGEGCHIEPDKKNSYSYLEACRDSLVLCNDEFYKYITGTYIDQIKRIKELERSLKLSINILDNVGGRILLNTYRYFKRIYRKLS